MPARSLLSWRNFDALLRGRLPPEERVGLLLSWTAWQTVCAAIFGASLGVFSITSRVPADPRFMAASLVKVPLLLFLTSVVTVPSLYVFGALRGLRYSAREFAALLMVAHTVLAAVLGSLAPVVAFFALTTTSYSFMVVLTVFACGVAGTIGIRVFVRALGEPARFEAEPPRLTGPLTTAIAVAEPSVAMAPAVATAPTFAPDPTDANAPQLPATVAPTPIAGRLPTPVVPNPIVPRLPSPPEGVSPGAWRLLGWWVFLYIFVGAQSGWILRPFIGHPDQSFVLFRGKSGGFVEGTLHHIWVALGGH